MRIEWFGHSCFLLKSKAGERIVTDPYEPGSYDGAVGYSDIGVEADIVTVSHKHFDHNYTQAVPEAEVVDEPKEYQIKGVEIRGIASFHDDSRGSKRGNNIIFILTVDETRIAHLGDLGHIPDNISLLKGLDVVFIPVGGVFTLDGEKASQLVDLIKPKIVIPMHFKTEKLKFDIDGVDKFLKGKPKVKDLGDSAFEIDKNSLPEGTEIWVLKPSR